MDAAFFRVVIELIGGFHDVDVPPPPNSFISGATLARRFINTRIEIWIGGTTEPPPSYVKALQNHFSRLVDCRKVLPYRPFKADVEMSQSAQVKQVRKMASAILPRFAPGSVAFGGRATSYAGVAR